MSTQEAFEQIYTTNAWGGSPGTFYSGPGSDEEFARSYCQLIRDFLRDHEIQVLVDLGCGDFRIGKQLIDDGVKYIGVDIVRPLVQHNQRQFSSSEIQFVCLDIAHDELPAGDVGLLHHVLQHLSNSEIQRILKKCQRYRYLFVTEHLSIGSKVRPNLDKTHGPRIRTHYNSGVFLDKPPFSLTTKTVLEVQWKPAEVLRTVLIETTNHCQ